MGIRAAAALREREAKVAAAELGNFKSLAQKETAKRNSKKWNENQKTIAKIRTKKSCERIFENEQLEKYGKKCWNQ